MATVQANLDDELEIYGLGEGLPMMRIPIRQIFTLVRDEQLRHVMADHERSLNRRPITVRIAE